jgi:hypothetical protein
LEDYTAARGGRYWVESLKGRRRGGRVPSRRREFEDVWTPEEEGKAVGRGG